MFWNRRAANSEHLTRQIYVYFVCVCNVRRAYAWEKFKALDAQITRKEEQCHSGFFFSSNEVAQGSDERNTILSSRWRMWKHTYIDDDDQFINK